MYVHICTCILQSECGIQRTTCERWFSPSMMWVSMTKLWLLDVVDKCLYLLSHLARPLLNYDPTVIYLVLMIQVPHKGK